MQASFFVFGYIGLLLFFPGSNWGIASDVKFFDLYSMGTGKLPFSLMTLALYLMFTMSFLLCNPNRSVMKEFTLRYYFWAFNLLFLIVSTFGLIGGHSIKEVFTTEGIVHVFNLYLLMVVLVRSVDSKNKLEILGEFIVLCALIRGLWGMYRWVYLGGDIANIYATAQRINIKLTFFDINDSLIATFAAFFSGWVLLSRGAELSLLKKLFYILMVCVGLAVVLFSYRRTAWTGLLMAGLWFTWQQPWKRRIQVASLVLILGLLALPTLVNQRFSSIVGGGGQSGFLYDVLSNNGEVGSEGRFSELANAWGFIEKKPIFGVLPWGGGSDGAPSFVHSGFVHLWLKGGVFAISIFMLIVLSYLISTIKFRKKIYYKGRAVFEASVAGFLFSFPNLAFGTPFIEYRTSQLLALMMVLPYLVYGLSVEQE